MNKEVRRIVIPVLAVLALIALALPKLGALGRTARNNGAASPARDQALAVRMQVIRPEKLSVKVATIGTILPNEAVEIRSEISGKIEKISFSEGTDVRKGDLLIKINDDELQAQLLRAQYRQKLAEQQEQRQRQLFGENLLPQEGYDRAVSELNVAKAEAQLIRAQIDKTGIRAPFDGKVGLRYVSEGRYVTPDSPITTLQDSSVVKIDFAIPEKYAGQVKKSDKVNFTTQGSSQTFTGTIYATDSGVDLATRTLRMRALSPNADGALLAGGFANIEVVLEEKEALMIPSYALIPELKGHKVLLCKEGRAVSQAVEIGTRTEDRVEITQGMQAGDTLILSGLMQLRSGMGVRLMD